MCMNKREAQAAIRSGFVDSVVITFSDIKQSWFVRFKGPKLRPVEHYLTGGRGPAEDQIRYYKSIDSAYSMLRDLGFRGDVSIYRG